MSIAPSRPRTMSDVVRHHSGTRRGCWPPATWRRPAGMARVGRCRMPPPLPASPDLASAALRQLPRRPSDGPLATRSHPGMSWAVGEGAVSQIWAVAQPQNKKHASSTLLTLPSSDGSRSSGPARGTTPPSYYRGIAYQTDRKEMGNKSTGYLSMHGSSTEN